MTRTTKATNKKLKGYLPISVKLDEKGAYYFKNYRAFKIFMNRLINIIKLEEANKPTEYPEPYIYQWAKNGVGRPFMPEIIKKAINNPIIINNYESSN